MPRNVRLILFIFVTLALTALGLTPDASAAAGPGPDVQTRATAVVTVAVLNVRAGPGTGYAVQGQVTAGTALQILGRNASGDWLNVLRPGSGEGWVLAALTSWSASIAGLPVSAAPAMPLAPQRIVAPAIGLDSRVVQAGWHYVRNADGTTSAEWDVPDYAAGWLVSSAHPGEKGNMVLSGHHNILGEVFRYVVNLRAGDAITIYAGGKTFNYRVVDRFILPDKYVSFEQRLQNATWIGPFPDERLTLVTCWPYNNNTHRVIVIAKP